MVRFDVMDGGLLLVDPGIPLVGLERVMLEDDGNAKATSKINL